MKNDERLLKAGMMKRKFITLFLYAFIKTWFSKMVVRLNTLKNKAQNASHRENHYHVVV